MRLSGKEKDESNRQEQHRQTHTQLVIGCGLLLAAGLFRRAAVLESDLPSSSFLLFFFDLSTAGPAGGFFLF